MSHFQPRISRRNLLKGMGLSVAGLALNGLPLQLVYAQGEAQPLASYRFNVGQFEVTVIRDLGGAFLPWTIYGANVEQDELMSFLERHGMHIIQDNLVGIIQTILVRNGEDYTLFDTGFGAASGGNLVATLEQLGVQPDQINTVLLSHYHPDHVNGLTDAEHNVVFPNAQVLMPQIEYDFLQSVPDDSPISDFVNGAKAQLEPYLASDHIAFYGDEDEVVAGIQAILTPGHTPGHMSFLLESEGSRLLASVDVAVSAYIGLERPDWHFGFDTDPVQAVETRKALFGRASDEQLLVFGYHFPFPGVGYVARQDNADEWRWLPAAF